MTGSLKDDLVKLLSIRDVAVCYCRSVHTIWARRARASLKLFGKKGFDI